MWMTHFLNLILELNHQQNRKMSQEKNWEELRRAEQREKSAVYYATLRRELQHVACSTKQQQRLAAKTRCKDSAAQTWLLYLHEVHQFKSEIKHNRILKQTKTSAQSCRKRRDSERAEDAIALGTKGGKRSEEWSGFYSFCLSAHEKYTEKYCRNILECHFPIFPFSFVWFAFLLRSLQTEAELPSLLGGQPEATALESGTILPFNLFSLE